MSDEQSFNLFIHHLLRRFFPHIASDFPSVPGLLPIMNPELVDILVKTTWVKTNVCIMVWSQFVKQHSERMYSSNALYVTYTLYACQVVNDGLIDFHDRFLSVISTVMAIAIIFSYTGKMKFLQYTSKILSVCFENMLKEEFHQYSSWSKLNKYIAEHNYLETYKDMSSHSKIGSLMYVKYAEEMNSRTQRTPKCIDDTIISQEDVEKNLSCKQLAENVLSDFQQEASAFDTSSKSSVSKSLTESSESVDSNTVLYSQNLKEKEKSCLTENDFKGQHSTQNKKEVKKRSSSSTTRIFRKTEKHSSRSTKKVLPEKVKKSTGITSGKSINSNDSSNYSKSKKDIIHSEFSDSYSKSIFSEQRKDNNMKEKATKKKEPEASKLESNTEKNHIYRHEKCIQKSNRVDKASSTTSQIACETSCRTADGVNVIEVSENCNSRESLHESKQTSSTNQTEFDNAIPNKAESNSSVLGPASKEIFEAGMEKAILSKAKGVLRDLICEAEALGDMLNFFV